MDRIDIPDNEVVPIESVAPQIQGLRIAFVNVFGIGNRDGVWVLVDTGIPLSQSRIRNWAEKNFDRAPSAILLTHGHFDHAGCAHELAEHWNVPVYAHADEQPYLAGEKEYPRPNFTAGGGMMSLLSPLRPRGPFNVGERLRVWRAQPYRNCQAGKLCTRPVTRTVTSHFSGLKIAR